MPIMRRVKFKCPKCGFVKFKMIGDVIMPNDLNVRCPMCGAKMEMRGDSLSVDDLIDTISSIFRGKK